MKLKENLSLLNFSKYSYSMHSLVKVLSYGMISRVRLDSMADSFHRPSPGHALQQSHIWKEYGLYCKGISEASFFWKR